MKNIIKNIFRILIGSIILTIIILIILLLAINYPVLTLIFFILVGGYALGNILF